MGCATKSQVGVRLSQNIGVVEEVDIMSPRKYLLKGPIRPQSLEGYPQFLGSSAYIRLV